MAAGRGIGPNGRQHYVGRSGLGCPGRTSAVHGASRAPGHKGRTGELSQGVYSGLVGTGRGWTCLSSNGALPLLKNVYCSQAGGKEEANYRSFALQQEDPEARVPHGRPPPYSKDHFSRSLGGENRPEGCVFRSPSLPKDLEIFPFCPRRRGRSGDLLFQSSPLWPDFCSLGLHQGDEGCQESASSTRHPGDFLPGRLPYPGSLLRGGSGTHNSDYRSSSAAGFSDQLGKVFHRTPEIPRVPGRHSGLSKHDFLSSRGKGSKDPLFLQRWPRGLEAYEKGVREAHRFLQLRGPVFEVGKAVLEAHCSLDESKYLCGPEGSLCSPRRLPQGGSHSLDGSGLPQVSHSHKTPPVFKDSHDGRLFGRLERDLAPSFCTGSLASRVGRYVNELERAKGSALIPHQVPEPVERSLRQNPFRQHDGSGLHQEGGFAGFRGSLGSGKGPAALCPIQGHLTVSSASEREIECPSRQGVEGWSNQHGMVSRPRFLQEDLRSLGSSSGGPVRHSGKLPASSVCLSVSRPLGSGMRCAGRQPGLESAEVNLPLSSLSTYRGSFVETEGLQGFRLLGDAILADGSLVRTLREEVSFQNPPPKRGLLVPEVFRDHVLPQVPLIFQASRLETIRAAILKEGLNDYSVRVLCRCHKVSTINQYQGVWSKFLLYLDSQRVLHHSIKVCHVINFLSYYSENFNLAYKTIAVYKNALRLPLLFGLGMNLDCPLVTHYMLGLHAIKPPPSHGFMPPWDLSDLLLFLQSREFFPLETCSFLRLSQKTLALILLASGRRIHEISSLSREFRRSGDKVVLYWPEGSKAKCYRVGHYPEDPSIRKRSHFCRT